jgi:hypothetical protein
MISSISTKAQNWASLAWSSGLKPQDFHTSVTKKFWPKIKYGLRANSSPFDDLVQAMHMPYYWMAPMGGLICSAKCELRYLMFLWPRFSSLGYWGINRILQ